MNELHLPYAVIGVAGLLLALLSRQIRQWPPSEPLVVMLLGVLPGPAVTGVLDLPMNCATSYCSREAASCWHGR